MATIVMHVIVLVRLLINTEESFKAPLSLPLLPWYTAPTEPWQPHSFPLLSHPLDGLFTPSS